MRSCFAEKAAVPSGLQSDGHEYRHFKCRYPTVGDFKSPTEQVVSPKTGFDRTKTFFRPFEAFIRGV